MSFFRFYFIFGNRKKKCLKKCGIRETENSVCSADIYVISLVFPFLCVPEVKSIFILTYYKILGKITFYTKIQHTIVHFARYKNFRKYMKLKFLNIINGNRMLLNASQEYGNNKKSETD